MDDLIVTTTLISESWCVLQGLEKLITGKRKEKLWISSTLQFHKLLFHLYHKSQSRAWRNYSLPSAKLSVMPVFSELTNPDHFTLGFITLANI